MKFVCNTRELSAACNNVIRAVSTKVTIPTIEGILIECGSNTLSLTGYDFEFGINTTLNVDVVEPGGIVINAKVLCNIIAKLSDEEVTVETNGTSVNSGIPVQFEQKMLHSMITQTLFAVADNESSKPVYTGLKFELNNNVLTLVGVDGYRLAIRKENINYDGDELVFIVPKKTIRELMKQETYCI